MDAEQISNLLSPYPSDDAVVALHRKWQSVIDAAGMRDAGEQITPAEWTAGCAVIVRCPLTHPVESDAIMPAMVDGEPWTRDKKRCAELVNAIEHSASREADQALGTIAARDKENSREAQHAQGRRRKAMQNVVVPQEEAAQGELKKLLRECCELLISARVSDESTLRQAAQDLGAQLQDQSSHDRQEILNQLLMMCRAVALVPYKGDGDPYGEGLAAISRIVGGAWHVTSLDLQPETGEAGQVDLVWSINGQERTDRLSLDGRWMDPDEFRDLVPTHPDPNDERQLIELDMSLEDGLSYVYARPQEWAKVETWARTSDSDSGGSRNSDAAFWRELQRQLETGWKPNTKQRPGRRGLFGFLK